MRLSLHNRPIHLTLLLALAFIVIYSGEIAAQARWVEDFSDFNEDDYHIGQAAYWDDDDEWFVLTEVVQGQSGRLYKLQEFPMAIFNAEFDIFIGGGGGSDGMAFAWVVDFDYQPSGGGELNIQGMEGFAIEFDTYPNGNHQDPNEEHLALVRNGVDQHLAVWQVERGVLDCNEWRHVTVTNFLGHIVVTWEGEEVIDYEIDNYEPFQGHFGYTGATGGDHNWHRVDNVVIGIGGPVAEFETDHIEFGPVPGDEVVESDFWIANISEDEDEWHRLEFTIEDIGDDPDWLNIDPDEGNVEAGDTTVITFTANLEGLELGEYERDVRIETNDPDNFTVDISFHIFVVEGFGQLTGRVIDAENQQAIEDALIEVPDFGFSTVSDENGDYTFPEIPAWTYDILITKEDYLPMLDRVEINAGEEVERNYALLHAEIILDPVRIELSLQPDDELEIPLNIRNGGNGPLTWSVERVFPEEMQIEPWEHRWHLPVAEVVDNSRLGGIAFVDNHFYVAGGVRDEDNIIYVLNHEGQLVRQFPQFAVSNYGIRDLTWDGQYLWGFDAGEIFGFTTEGELEVRYRPPEGSIRGITWDPERNLLWICNITTDIYGIDRNGNLEITIDRPGDLHIYGLSWYPEDEDGFNLYMFCCDGENRRQVHKMDVNSGEFEIICEVDVEGRAGAATISGLWDPYSWVFIGLTQANPDAIEIWQLNARTEWLAIDPVEGIIEPNEETELTVTLNTLGLPEEEEFTADLTFTHDGIGGVTEIPINLMVTLEGGVSQRILRFDLGWNMVSLNVEPPDNDVRVIMQPLVEADLLDLMKDGMGRFYNPAFNFNNIPFWNTAEGYQVKVNQECELSIEGEVVPWNTPIPLLDGWQIVSYYPRDAVNAVTALSDIVDNLIIAKNASGRFYVPEFGFNGIGDMREGQGYQMKMDADDDLVYTIENDELASLESDQTELFYFNRVAPTGNNMSLLVIGDKSHAGCELGVLTSDGVLAGSGLLDASGRCGLAVWGDDPLTEAIDGTRNGEQLSFKLWNGERENTPSFEIVKGKTVYRTDELLVLNISSKITIPVEFGLTSIYPNPFNSVTTITFSVDIQSKTSLRVFDIAGREVVTLFDNVVKVGKHNLKWDASSVSSGVYLLRLETENKVKVTKIALMR